MLRQTPRILHNYLARLESFAPVPSAWPEASHVLESRDASWLDVETAACLRSHGGANCLSDTADSRNARTVPLSASPKVVYRSRRRIPGRLPSSR